MAAAAAKHGNNDTESSSQEKCSGPPDGGMAAWLVVCGGFTTYFATFGLLNSFGTFQVYYKEEYLTDKSESAISWIGSIQLFLLFIGGVVFGPAFDRMGARFLFVPGTLIYVVSLMFTSLCTEYYQLILAQGVLFGIGDSILFYPTISAIPQHFNRHRGLAMGIVVSGSSLGGIAWPMILDRLVAICGFGWALRISGFICLALLVPSCAFVRERLPPTNEKKQNGSGPALGLILKDAKYMLLVAGMFLIMWGMFIPFYYLPVLAIELGASTYMANVIITALNAGSLVGRIVSGIAADKWGTFNIAILVAIISGVILLSLHAVESDEATVAFSVLYGFFSGGLISLQSACVARITEDLQTIGLKIGIMMAICSFGVLTGSPIGGALVAKDSGAFVGLITFSGVILLVGAGVLIGSRLAIDRRFFKNI